MTETGYQEWAITLVNAMHLATLGRELDPEVRSAWAKNMTSVDGAVGALSDLSESADFQRQWLGRSVMASTPEWSGARLAFVHIPKTAGTSVLKSLTASIGIQPLQSYGRRGDVPSDSWTKFRFWPFLAGHCLVDEVPTSYVGATILREERSRLLSLYRFLRRYPPTDPNIAEARWEERSMRLGEARMPFGRWLIDSASVTSSWAGYRPLASPHKAVDRSRGNIPMSDFYRGFGRIQHAAWAHDESGVQALITAATGAAGTLNFRENVAESVSSDDVIEVRRADLELLGDATRDDRASLQAAMDLGLVPELDPSERDGIFEETAIRLGYKLA